MNMGIVVEVSGAVWPAAGCGGEVAGGRSARVREAARTVEQVRRTRGAEAQRPARAPASLATQCTRCLAAASLRATARATARHSRLNLPDAQTFRDPPQLSEHFPRFCFKFRASVAP